MIVSSEELCSLEPDKVYKCSQEIKKCGFEDVLIIAYVRRQDELIESSYNMKVKWWGRRLTSCFESYVASKSLFIDYNQVLSLWEGCFSIKNICVRPFNSDACQDFLSIIKCPFPMKSRGRVNESLSPKALEFVRIMNQLRMDRFQHQKITCRMLGLEKERCVLFSPEERRLFLKPLIQSNRQLSRFCDGIDSYLCSIGTLKKLRLLELTEFYELFQYVSEGEGNVKS